MSQSNNIKRLTISLLCGAILTACGGGGEHTESVFLDNSNKSGGDLGGSGDSGDSSVTAKPEPTVNIFLTNISDQGLQNSPSVASIDNSGVGNIDKPVNKNDDIRFNQAAIVSEVCGWGGDCRDKDAVKLAEDLKELAGKTEDEAEKSRLEQWAKHIEDQFPENNKRVIRGVNGEIIIPKSLSTVDIGNFSSKDLGVLKIDRKREADGTVKKYSGTVDRAFTNVLGFKRINLADPSQGKETLWLNAFFRNPSTAGWSYQTFGNYISNSEDNYLLGKLRAQNVGYQSIGQITQNVPTSGQATYRGISHAYYNSDQVTSKNEITADFKDKKLTYQTVGKATLHTVENGLHYIQDREDLNISGSASWGNVNRFKGSVSTKGGLQGKIEGQFYGPNAEEIGGVYGLGHGTTTHYIGGFGGKR